MTIHPMWTPRQSLKHFCGAMALMSILLATGCSSAPLSGGGEEDGLVRPAEPLAPEPAAEVPPEDSAGTAETASPAPAGASINRIHSLELSDEGSETVLEVVASEPMVWLSQREGEKRMVIELPGTFPGPEVEEIATFEGLVAAVLFEADAAEPRTRLIVLTRGPAVTSLVPRGNRLRIKLSPAPEPEPAKSAPAAVAPTADADAVEIFEVQLGLFSVAANAAGLAADLARRDYPAYVVEVSNASGKVFHTVRLGPYASRSQAQKAAAAYREQEGGETLVRWRERSSGSEE